MYSRLQENDGAGNKGAEERAKALLNRVLLMRVFDFVGVVEAIGEIGAGLEAKAGYDGYDGMEGAAGDWDRDGVDEIEGSKQRGPETDEEGRVGMIIIDSMTNVVSAMMSRDHVQGKSLHLRPPIHLSSTSPCIGTNTDNDPLTPQATPS